MNDIRNLVKSLSFIEEFVEMATVLATERDVQRLLSKVLLSARNFTHCEAGRVYVLDVTKQHLQLRVSQWNGVQDQGGWYAERSYSQMTSAAASDPLIYCSMTGNVVLIDDVYSYAGYDLEYIYAHDKMNSTRTQSLILIPLRNHKKQTIGILELINAKDASDRRYVSFKPLETIVLAFAAQATVCINNALLIESNDHLIGLLDDTNQRLEKENKILKERNTQYREYNIIGQSEPMRYAFSLMEKAMNTGVSILLRGETGTGKEVFARAIHENSIRRDKRFVAQNCAALPEQLLESELFGYKKGAFTGAVTEKKGLFQLADEGTLLLDEIGDMPVNLQSKILRVLQEGEVRPLGSTEALKVNVRLVAATHCDLLEKISQGGFRQDLYFRLNVFPITLPPLRERGSDLKLLMSYFLAKYASHYKKNIVGVSPKALDVLLAYSFPGNVRELQNAIERAVLLCEDNGTLMIEHLPDVIRDQIKTMVQVGGKKVNPMVPGLDDSGDSCLKSAVSAYEIAFIKQHLQANNWNQTRTATTLQVPRRTLIDKMSRYNIKTPEKRNRVRIK